MNNYATEDSLMNKYRESNKKSRKNLSEPKQALKEIADRLENNLEVVEKACVLVERYKDETNLRGLESMRTYLSAYYIATRKKGEARSKRQIENVFTQLANGYSGIDQSEYTTKELSRTSKRIVEDLDIERDFCKPSDYLAFWNDIMDLTDEEYKALKTIIGRVESMIEYNGYSPLPLSGSVVWLIKGDEYSPEQIADYCVSTDTTIRRNGESIFYDVNTSDIDSYDFESQKPTEKLSKGGE